MSKVSIIVPIYNVEKYIERCVVSLFEQDFDDIEYVFVNDCTPDNSVDILQKVIEKHPNRKPYINIIHHKQNKGLGSARNTGLKQATGDYVLHIDSDDWCELDMVSLLYSKAKETDADIIVCDYFLSYKDKDIYKKQDYSLCRESDLHRLLRSDGLFNFVWNKLIKRNLYYKFNIFPPTEINFYEDKSVVIRFFSENIEYSYVPKAFVHYWQENQYSLSLKKSNKIFEDIKCYVQTTEQFLKAKGILDKYKHSFYIGNLKTIIWQSSGQYDRKLINSICPEANKLKYLRQTQLWASPSSWRHKMQLLLCFLNLQFLIKPAKITNRILRKVHFGSKRFIELLFLGVSYLMPRNKNIWLFGGVSESFNDNVKYLFIYVAENCPELRPIWISEDKSIIEYIKSKGLEAYSKYSFKGIYYSLRSKFYFFFDTVLNINFWTSGGAVKVNLWHGVPIKKIHFDIKNHIMYDSSIKSRWLYPHHYIQSDYMLSTSKKVSELFSSAFKVASEQCLEYGYPRNEILSYSKEKLMAFVNKYEPIQTKKLIQDIQQYKKVFVYMPTWRDNGRDFIQDAGLDFKMLTNIMKDNNFCFILKLHHMTKLPIGFESNKNIVLLYHKLDIYPILPFTDCLITDYSSIYFDYKLMHKEVVLFPFDKEEYLEKDREMYYSYELVTENQSVANNFEELIAIIQSDTIGVNDNTLIREMIFESQEIESSKAIVNQLR